MLGLAHCVLELPVFSHHSDQYRRTRIRSRQSHGPVEESIINHLNWTPFGGYYIDLTIGTPPQVQTVLLSTGSSNLYFNSIISPTCNSSFGLLETCLGGLFNSSASTTYSEVASPPAFDVKYGGGSEVVGPIGKDTLGIGQLTLDNVQFGLGEKLYFLVDHISGMLGLGYITNEDEDADKLLSPFLNMPAVMVRENLTASRLFSIALDRTDRQGSVTFGGIDSTRYTGELATIDLLNVTQPYVGIGGQNTTAIEDFITTITQAEYITGDDTKLLWVSGSDSISAWDSDDPAVPVHSETAASVTTLPQEYYDLYIAPRFPYLDSSYSCICAYADTQDRIRLTFADKIKVEVNVKDLIRPMVNYPTVTLHQYENGTDRCELLIRPGGSKASTMKDAYMLGGPVLESMYMVFDMDNNQISIAEAATEVSETRNIIAVEAGPDGVAKAVASLNSSTRSSGSPPSSTATDSPHRDTLEPDSPSRINTGVIAGAAVGGTVVLAMIGGAGYFLLRRKRKAPSKHVLPDDSSPVLGDTYAHYPKDPRFNGDPTLE
ncbi:hypothetical protein BST61_g9249 [Cercospora zeina]